jgi:hypothetical protein
MNFDFDFSDVDMPVWNRSFFAETMASDYVASISAEFEQRRDSLDQFLAGLAKVMTEIASYVTIGASITDCFMVSFRFFLCDCICLFVCVSSLFYFSSHAQSEWPDAVHCA